MIGKGLINTQNTKDIVEKKLKYGLPNDIKIKKFSLGKDFILCIDENNQFYSMGSGKHGILGRGRIEEYSETFVKLTFDGKIKDKEEFEEKIEKNESIFNRTRSRKITNMRSDFSSIKKKITSNSSSFENANDFQVFCAPTFALAVNNGKIYAWGSFFSSKNDESPLFQILLPTLFSPLSSSPPLCYLSCSSNLILAQTGFVDKENFIRFESFYPPSKFSNLIKKI